jgi:hypothetical protein
VVANSSISHGGITAANAVHAMQEKEILVISRKQMFHTGFCSRVPEEKAELLGIREISMKPLNSVKRVFTVWGF